MKQLVLCSAVLLLCASVSQAHPQYGYTVVYNFDDLDPNYYVPDPNDPNTQIPLLNGASDSLVTWRVSEAGNIDRNIVGNVGGDQNASTRSGFSSERLSSSLNSTPGSILNLDSNDTYLLLSYTTYHTPYSTSWTNGIWCDLDGNNTMPNSEAEIAVQFGMYPNNDPNRADRHYRVRGFAGSTTGYSGGWQQNDPNGKYPKELEEGSFNAKLSLVVDLNTYTANLIVENLDLGISAQVITGVSLGDPVIYATLANPANWTGWTVRNQGDTPVTTADNLTVQVIPEPATLSLLVLGGLAVIRRRR